MRRVDGTVLRIIKHSPLVITNSNKITLAKNESTTVTIDTTYFTGLFIQGWLSGQRFDAHIPSFNADYSLMNKTGVDGYIGWSLSGTTLTITSRCTNSVTINQLGSYYLQS